MLSVTCLFEQTNVNGNDILSLQVEPADNIPTQIYCGYTVQVLEQPSPLIVLPSSQG